MKIRDKYMPLYKRLRVVHWKEPMMFPKTAEDRRRNEDIQSVTSRPVMRYWRKAGIQCRNMSYKLKDWEHRHHSVKEVMEILEETKDWVPWLNFWTACCAWIWFVRWIFFLRLLNKNSTVDYQDFDKVNTEFMTALNSGKNCQALFTFYAANYPSMRS